MIIIWAAVFLLFIGLCVYPLGNLVTRNFLFSEKFTSNLVVVTVLGLLVFTLECFLLGLIGLFEIVPYIITLQSAVLLFKGYYFQLEGARVNIILLVFIVTVTFVNSVLTFPFGQITDKGIRFAGAHGNDSSWHLSIINSLQQGYPPNNPVYDGVVLKNYHYLVDLQIAEIGEITHIPNSILFYQIIGPFYIFIYSVLAYHLGEKLSGRRFGGALAVLFTALSNNWYYITNLIYPTSFNRPSVAWIDYFSTKSVNYPLLFSMIVMFLIFYLILETKKLNFKTVVLIALIVGSLISIKSHTGIVLIASFGILAVIRMISRDFSFTKIFILSGLFGGGFLLSTFSPGSQGLLFHPFWFIRTMYEAPDRLNLDDWELQRQYLLTLGSIKSYFSIAKLYITGLVVFLFTNLGIAVVAPFTLRRKVSSQKLVVLLMVLISVFSFVFTMLFIYKGIAIVTIQFFYPAVVCLFLLLAVLLSKRRFVAVLVWMTLLPGVIFTLKDFSFSNIYYPPDQTRAVEFLSAQKYGVVLTSPFFNTNAVVSAYSGKPIFYTEDIIPLTGEDYYKARAQAVSQFFECKDSVQMKNIISKNNIKYVLTNINGDCLEDMTFLEKAFEDSEIKVFTTSENLIQSSQIHTRDQGLSLHQSF